MLQSAERDRLLGAVHTELRALEALCGTIERALMARRWEQMGEAIADSRRVTHALENAMDDARALRDEAFDAEVFQRLRYVHTIRENQLSRLKTYQNSLGERLSLIAKWKSAARSIGKRRVSSRLANLDQLT